MNINGKWYTEPQLEAYVMALEAKLAEVEAKHELECMQIAHYDDELAKVKELLAKVPAMLNNLCFAVSEPTGCDFCPYGRTNPGGACDVETLRKAIESIIGGKTND